MARKPKQQTPAKVQPTSESIEASSLRESQPPRASRRLGSILLSANTSKALGLVILAALWSPLSQLALSPVYGSIPAAAHHKYGLIGSSLLAFALRGFLPERCETMLPSYAFWAPTIQFVLFKYSNSLGNPAGPLVTELLTCFPVITLALYLAARHFDDVDLSFLSSDSMQEAAPSMVLYMLFTIIERVFKDVLPQLSSIGFATSRTGLQLVLATTFGLLLPQSLLWPAVPSIAFTMVGNLHNPLQRTTNVLNNTLALSGYSLLERRESITGYLSVLEDRQKGFRVMRCDHSLLGGEWLDIAGERPERKVAEPIYAVFTMMEAVRLVHKTVPKAARADIPERALNIGLGVGTAPSALIAHGINTTIIELDPMVHYFAGKYFNLPKNHSYYIGDAVGIVEYNAEHVVDDQRYDYILHDVFTGGAVPTSLLTVEFLNSLSKLLKPDGTIAINYAGDLNMPSAAMIHHTIKSVFPNCRVFREEPESGINGAQDFTNMVYFCTHATNTRPIKFRKPVTADFLGSGARQRFLLPKHEVNVDDKFGREIDPIDIVGRNNKAALKKLNKWQAQSAIGHWSLMRTVIPDMIWENW